MNSVIRAKGVCKTYSNNFEALKSIDFEIGESSFFTLLGPNGAGKSTLLKILCGLLSPTKGIVEIRKLNPVNDFMKIQYHLGVCSQENDLDPSVNAYNMLIFQGKLFGMSTQKARERAHELIEIFTLKEEAHKKAQELSGGNKRKLHCALGLVHRPNILFLDEPTVGMDPLARDNFWKVIRQLNKDEQLSIFLTTQYLEEAEKHANEMGLIIQGQLHFLGKVQDFKKKMHPEINLSLEESYLKYVRNLEEKGNDYEL